ncbi:MAG: galactokinase [Holophagales bacterium]|jgi:galactokinase|nr:galactokinase [Holophagales bacterium]
MTPVIIDRVREAFEARFGRESILIRAPGRVNLIGEHTDYNEGYVLPAAIDRAIYLAMKPGKESQCHWVSLDLNQTFDLTAGIFSRSELGWPDYLQGVLVEFSAMGIYVPPVDAVFGGDIPIGSGMSSSAALTTGFAFAINSLFNLGLDRVAIAKLGQRAENNFVGMNCGIMDQFASVLGREKTLLQLDCRDLSCIFVPFSRADVRVVLCDSQVKHSHAGGEYNTRRSQCETGVEILKRHHPEIVSLRDISPDMLDAARPDMDEVVYRRCSYVIAENQRVLAACNALADNDLATFGVNMNHSHYGMRDEYEITCPELDALQSVAESAAGVLGSRMTGGGFGGCTVNLVEEVALADFQNIMGEAFRQKLGKEPIIHICQLKGGTEELG